MQNGYCRRGLSPRFSPQINCSEDGIVCPTNLCPLSFLSENWPTGTMEVLLLELVWRSVWHKGQTVVAMRISLRISNCEEHN